MLTQNMHFFGIFENIFFLQNGVFCKIVMQKFARFTLSVLSKMYIVCYVLHAKFDVLAIIHVILFSKMRLNNFL
jgi:hypothetical protein